MTVKIVINKCHGGFGLSLKALEMLAELKGFGELHHYSLCYEDWIYKKHPAEDQDKETLSRLSRFSFTENVGDTFSQDLVDEYFKKYNLELDFERHDMDLIKVVETLGREADSPHSRPEIVEIPKEVEYQIEDYVGLEWVAEKHRTWG